ncbi:MAG: LpqB family beta-propeller domain-containing protein [Verrucomicrobiales bacterium]|nr:LpqB family beta-propeller domain-containing protein [Verrucomicrobiales bacterium]
MLAHEIKSSGFFYLAKPQPGAYVVKGRFTKDGLEGLLLHPDGHEIFKRVYASKGLQADVRQLADDITLAAAGRPGISTSQIAFVSKRSGKPDIYIADYDGKNIRQITRDGLPKRHPYLSPNGRFLCFTGMARQGAGIYKIDLASNQRTLIATGHGDASERAVVSPDGKSLALVLAAGGNSDIYISKNSGKSQRRLISSSIAELQPSWSADGRSLVYTAVMAPGATQLFVVNAKTGKKPTPLAINLPNPTQATWSPDGRRIAFVSGTGSNTQIAIHHLRDRSNRVLTTGQSPAWGADSKHLIYVDRGSLYRIDVDSGKKQKLISGGSAVYDPSWTR